MAKRRFPRPGPEKIFPAGKLPMAVLARLLARYAVPGERVVVGPAVGIDAAALDFGDRLLLAKTDPITFVAENIGAYAVHINANDIAVMGGTPRWFLATLLLPEGGATLGNVRAIFRDLHHACRSLKIGLCGGHTEITAGIDRPILVGQMLGEVPRKGLITAAGARSGDLLILTKGIAVEGTTILARERGPVLARAFSDRFVRRCRRFIHSPGISVVNDARIALKTGRVHAMHDPTEGGLATGLLELAAASRVGLRVESSAISIFPEFRKLCDYFGLAPLGVIASGALLLSVDPGDAARMVRALAAAGIPAAVIGEVVPKRRGVRLMEEGKSRPLPVFERDEIARLFSAVG